MNDSGQEQQSSTESRLEEFRHFLDKVPSGGIGFHGTTAKFSEEIESRGLNAEAAKQSYIFYRVFNPNAPEQSDLSLEWQISELRDRILGGIEIAQNRRGHEGKSPVLVVFRDDEGRGERTGTHPYPTMIIKEVPKAGIVGIYQLGNEEHQNDFVRRVEKDIVKKIIIGGEIR